MVLTGTEPLEKCAGENRLAVQDCTRQHSGKELGQRGVEHTTIERCSIVLDPVGTSFRKGVHSRGGDLGLGVPQGSTDPGFTLRDYSHQSVSL